MANVTGADTPGSALAAPPDIDGTAHAIDDAVANARSRHRNPAGFGAEPARVPFEEDMLTGSKCMDKTEANI
jgi:hypothetical protein